MVQGCSGVVQPRGVRNPCKELGRGRPKLPILVLTLASLPFPQSYPLRELHALSYCKDENSPLNFFLQMEHSRAVACPVRVAVVVVVWLLESGIWGKKEPVTG